MTHFTSVERRCCRLSVLLEPFCKNPPSENVSEIHSSQWRSYGYEKTQASPHLAFYWSVRIYLVASNLHRSLDFCSCEVPGGMPSMACQILPVSIRSHKKMIKAIALASSIFCCRRVEGHMELQRIAGILLGEGKGHE
jgi:hypothetical protein